MSENAAQPQSENAEPAKPSTSAVYRYLVYGMSLPERTLRGTSAVIGGVIKESADLLVPGAFRSSRSYQTFVGQMLDFMINDVAGVPKEKNTTTTEPEVENYVARKTVSSFIDLAGMATLHVSPLAVLAILSDVAHGSQTYLRELAVELKREGVISQESTIDSTADLLDAISRSAGQSADVFDTPPLSVDGLRKTIEETRASVSSIDPSKLIPLSEIDRTWQEMKSVANEQNVSLFGLSSAITMYSLNRVNSVAKGALSTVRVTGNMFDRHILEHYREGLADINERGIWQSLSENSKPYVDAVWNNFSSDRETITEELVSGRLIGKAWNGVMGLFRTKETSAPGPADETVDPEEDADSSPTEA